jgi:hypothetical protein
MSSLAANARMDRAIKMEYQWVSRFNDKFDLVHFSTFVDFDKKQDSPIKLEDAFNHVPESLKELSIEYPRLCADGSIINYSENFHVRHLPDTFSKKYDVFIEYKTSFKMFKRSDILWYQKIREHTCKDVIVVNDYGRCHTLDELLEVTEWNPPRPKNAKGGGEIKTEWFNGEECMCLQKELKYLSPFLREHFALS